MGWPRGAMGVVTRQGHGSGVARGHSPGPEQRRVACVQLPSGASEGALLRGRAHTPTTARTTGRHLLDPGRRSGQPGVIWRRWGADAFIGVDDGVVVERQVQLRIGCS